MTQATMTKRGNILLNGEKFYAVRSKGCNHCALQWHESCGENIHCTPAGRSNPGYRLTGEGVVFVSREAYLAVKGKHNAG